MSTSTKWANRTEEKQIGAMVDSSGEGGGGEDIAAAGFSDPEGSSLSGRLRKTLKYTCSSSDSSSNSNPSCSNSSIERLDDELLVEILHRVACIKSATRCKCVCKRWLDLINPNSGSDSNSDPYLVRRFMRRNYERNRKLPFCLVNRMDPVLSNLRAVDTKEDPVSHEFVTLHKNRTLFRSMNSGCGLSLSFLPCEDSDRICVLASSNGLLVCCPSIYDQSVYFICNPVTKQWLSLPPPPLSSQKARNFSGTYRGIIQAGLTYQGQDDINVDFKFNPGCKFRLVCVPATVEKGQGVEVEVFSSENGEWTSSVLQRPPDAARSRGGPYFSKIVVCNGIVYWLEREVFVGFNPWDNTYRFIPRPVDVFNPLLNHFILNFGVCQGLLWAIIFGRRRMTDRYSQEGKRFGVYALKNGEWFLEHNVVFSQLTSTSNKNKDWLDNYAKHKSCYNTKILAFHPNDGDVVYLGCLKWIVRCNMREKTWQVVDEFNEWLIGTQKIFPLTLPWWPTPVPLIPRSKTVPSKEQVKENYPTVNEVEG